MTLKLKDLYYRLKSLVLLEPPPTQTQQWTQQNNIRNYCLVDEPANQLERLERTERMKSAEYNPTDNVEQTMTSLVRRLFEHTRGKQGHKAETETGKTIFEWHCGISSEPGRPA